MKKRNGYIRREWGHWVEKDDGSGDVEWVVTDVTYQPIDDNHKAIPNGYWGDGTNPDNWMQRQETPEAQVEWWEVQDALDGLAGKKRIDNANDKRKKGAHSRHADWQDEAESIWQDDPDASKSAVARKIAIQAAILEVTGKGEPEKINNAEQDAIEKRAKTLTNTIRREIKKPE